MRRFLSGIHFSISTRLAIWFGLSFLLLLSVFVVFLYVGFHVGLHRDFETQLERERMRAMDLVRRSGGDVRLEGDRPLTAGSYDVEGTGGTYVRLVASSGEVLQRSANMEGGGFSPDLPAGSEAETVVHTWRGAPARSVYTPIVGEDGELAAWLEVTRLESALHDALHRLVWLLAAGVLLAAAIAMAAGRYLAHRALRPVARITEASRQIQAEDLNRRVPSNFGVRDELTELAETLNALLDRLSASFERERRFRADAAHEMFTPLSAIQSEVDVTLRKARSGSEYHDALDAVRGHAHRLKNIVESLLELSRAEALEAGRTQTVDAVELATREVDRFRGRAGEHGVQLEALGEEAVPVRIDPSDLSTILSNLIDNALKYTPEGGRICVEATSSAGQVVIEVRDTGVGFEPEERAHLFDRFYRANAPGSGSASGSGLGLSIVQAVTAAYGGAVEAESEGPGRGSRFRVVLPGGTQHGRTVGRPQDS